MDFKDFENKQDLVGRSVLYDGYGYCVTKIVKVTKDGFRIAGNKSLLFNFNDGYLKPSISWYTVRCKLLTKKEEIMIRNELYYKKLKTKLIKQIKEIEDYDKIDQINKILNGDKDE